MKGYSIDPQTNLVQEQFATIYAPRKQRKRFPENCVTVADSEKDAITKMDKSKNILAAKVLGPCRSSEGISLYYLIQWLEN